MESLYELVEPEMHEIMEALQRADFKIKQEDNDSRHILDELFQSWERAMFLLGEIDGKSL